MSIYIEELKKPKDCTECAFYTGIACGAKRYGEIYGTYIENAHELPDWCPIMELPKHGRLIDADKLAELCNIMADKCDGIGKSIWEQFRATVEWSPTIIEAEE